MSKTQKDVIYKSMRRLNLIGASEEPNPSDFQEALEEYEGFHEWLIKEFPRQIQWNKDQVPEYIWTHVAGWFAGRLADVLPSGETNQARAKNAAVASETYFREILARKTIKTVEVNYF